VKLIKWNELKNDRLKKSRGVSFNEIIRGRLIAVKRHPNREYQDIMLFEYKNYIWVVPFVKSNGEIFLKTLFPSRKYTKLFKEGKL
jgi:hypothetical protein